MATDKVAVYAVWFFPADASLGEDKALHPAAHTTVEDLLNEYGDRYDRIIQIRYIEPPDELGKVVWHDERMRQEEL